MGTTGGTAALEYAGFWTRFAANLIDGVIVGVVSLIFIWVTLGVGIFVAWLLGLVYVIGMWAARGQTLGKMAMGVRIIKMDGSPLTLGTAILRYIGYLVSGIILYIGFLMIAWDSKKQGLHDKIAGTYVVKV